MKSLRRKAAAHRKAVARRGAPPADRAPREAAYTGPVFDIPAPTKAQWDKAMDDAITGAIFGTDVDGDARENAAKNADVFRAGLNPVQQRRFDQEKAIGVSQEEWRRASGPEGQRDTPAQMRAKMRGALKDLFADKKVAIRVTPQDLTQVLRVGRFRTIHETGKSNGFNDPRKRKELEEQVYGINPQTSEPTDRPVSGYVAVNGIRRASLDSALGQYGPVQVVLKDAVRQRTTAMVGDSMGQRNNGRPSPIDAPEHWSYVATPRFQAPGQYQVDPEELAARSYAEATVHGGVSVDDFEEVVFSREPDDVLKGKLADRGIPWRIEN